MNSSSCFLQGYQECLNSSGECTLFRQECALPCTQNIHCLIGFCCQDQRCLISQQYCPDQKTIGSRSLVQILLISMIFLIVFILISVFLYFCSRFKRNQMIIGNIPQLQQNNPISRINSVERLEENSGHNPQIYEVKILPYNMNSVREVRPLEELQNNNPQQMMQPSSQIPNNILVGIPLQSNNLEEVIPNNFNERNQQQIN